MTRLDRRDFFAVTSAVVLTRASAQDAHVLEKAPTQRAPSPPVLRLPESWTKAATIPVWPGDSPPAFGFVPQALPADWSPAFVRNVRDRICLAGWAPRADVPLQDAPRAMRVIRSQASRLGFDAENVSVVGLSVGGHLAASLGLTLFVRHHRRIELTNAGRILLEKARTAAEAATDLREVAEELKGVRAVRLGIACGLWSAVERIRAMEREQS